MANSPPWRDLKHLSSPTTVEYSDGQTFLDILECALPCIVQLLPPNSCLVKVIQIMVKALILLGLNVATETRLGYLRKFIAEYEKICNNKGTSWNQNTRVSEGFQQEIATQYTKTNGKDAEHQVNEWQKSQEEDEKDVILLSHAHTAHWRLGSADARMSSIRIETLNRSKPLYRDFNMCLREYLVSHHPT
ncbi:hypothetical protein DFH08DRAFT_828328 [Mycena albidolilacea]|uniref:Uncharacterized protein n=1 Tax=Mycena albidolilacea TaxID=1033008 RepID=A0AAD6YWK0_9AGAR|nr:hypothetical protein DFH08DRAFT_828328 [Mycena albidolilacea]